MSRRRSIAWSGASELLPNLLVIGGQKCGTTSLHSYLGLHPDVSMAGEKELDFFIEAGTLAERGSWERGVDWYSSRFAPGGAKVRGDTSPNYTAYPLARGVPERAAAVVPGARLIYMVRDPIERVVSHYMHRRAAGLDARALEQVLADPGSRYGLACRSMYAMQLERWLRQFPSSSVLVVAQEELRARRVETLRRVFRHLEVDDSFVAPEFSMLHERSAAKREPSSPVARLRASRLAIAAGALAPAPLRRRLGRAYRALPGRRLERPVLADAQREQLRLELQEDVDRFRALTGRSFASWSV